MLSTPWTERIQTECPLPEYPRPQMVRDLWINLNGMWNYSITESPLMPECFEGEILVPFSPESILSGVGRVLEKNEYLWYQKKITIPKEFFGKRIILHFGAVDSISCFYSGNHEIFSHTGGYLPFQFEITDYLDNDGSIDLKVMVRDYSDSSYHSRGKQKKKSGGIWYSRQSGIWQTVWMEAVPEDYIESVSITPDYDNACVYIEAFCNGNTPAVISFAGREYRSPALIPVPDFQAWTPDTPKLYDFTVICGEDKIKSYFAMRKFSIERDCDGNKKFFLNNKPIFQNGLLDQGYWPDGLYTAPSDEALIYDIETAKNCGFNVLRKHIKIEPLRWYYHCDRLGMLVWQDMVNGGGKYLSPVVIFPLFTNIHLRDNHYILFGRKSREGREEFVHEMNETVKLLYNCPCISLWTIFNEGWGQFDSAEMFNRLKAIDPTRLIDHASGWHDQGIGDIRSWHVYFKPFRLKKDKFDRAVILSEFGGYSHRISGHTFNESNFGYKHYDDPEKLRIAFQELYEKEIAPAKEKGLAAAIYTELTDIEDELNGLMTYDRKVLKIPADIVRSIINK